MAVTIVCSSVSSPRSVDSLESLDEFLAVFHDGTGKLLEIQATTLSRLTLTTDESRKLLTEKLSRSIMEHREELIQALKGIDSTGDETDEQIEPMTIVAAIASSVASGSYFSPYQTFNWMRLIVSSIASF
ncbi:hypothetical protein MTO96_047760 [Rhipicephalus appendiculatus]